MVLCNIINAIVKVTETSMQSHNISKCIIMEILDLRNELLDEINYSYAVLNLQYISLFWNTIYPEIHVP